MIFPAKGSRRSTSPATFFVKIMLEPIGCPSPAHGRAAIGAMRRRETSSKALSWPGASRPRQGGADDGQGELADWTFVHAPILRLMPGVWWRLQIRTSHQPIPCRIKPTTRLSQLRIKHLFFCNKYNSSKTGAKVNSSNKIQNVPEIRAENRISSRGKRKQSLHQFRLICLSGFKDYARRPFPMGSGTRLPDGLR